MKKLNTSFIIIITFLYLLGVADNSFGQEVTVPFEEYSLMFSNNNYVKWPINPAPLRIRYMVHDISFDNNRFNLNERNIDEIIRDSFDTWESVLQDTIIFSKVDYNQNLVTSHRYITIKCENNLNASGVIRRGYDGNSYFGFSIISLKKEYFWGDFSFEYYWNNTLSGNTYKDFQGVLTHEIGHAIGLGDYKSQWTDYFFWEQKTMSEEFRGGGGTHYHLHNIY